jgi:hypothetical protein
VLVRDDADTRVTGMQFFLFLFISESGVLAGAYELADDRLLLARSCARPQNTHRYMQHRAPALDGFPVPALKPPYGYTSRRDLRR